MLYCRNPQTGKWCRECKWINRQTFISSLPHSFYSAEGLIVADVGECSSFFFIAVISSIDHWVKSQRSVVVFIYWKGFDRFSRMWERWTFAKITLVVAPLFLLLDDSDQTGKQEEQRMELSKSSASLGHRKTEKKNWKRCMLHLMYFCKLVVSLFPPFEWFKSNGKTGRAEDGIE